MTRRFLLLLACLLALGAGLGLLWNALRAGREKRLYLPEAQNDFILGAVGLPGAAGSSAPEGALPGGGEAASSPAEGLSLEEAPSVGARPERDSYPVGTASVTLVVENRGGAELEYTGWFDLRRVEGDFLLPLTPREGLAPAPDDPADARLLAPGETARIDVPIDLFDRPLEPGTYRAAQLCCFVDAGGNALACTEIAADFVIESK